MKISKYTSSVAIDEKHTLLFNALSDKFVAVKNKVMDIDSMSITLLKEYPALYHQLEEAGIIIDDDVDELDILCKRMSQSENNDDEFILHLNPTLDCNFKCWYCYENHIAGSKMNDEVKSAVKKFIRSILSRPAIKSFELGFFGGEPLYFFHDVAEDIIAYTGDLCKECGKLLHIHFTSNGALLNAWIISFLSRYSCGFQITLDGGKPNHDKTRFSRNGEGSFDAIVTNIKLLSEAKIETIVRVNYTGENIDSVDSIFDSFAEIPMENKKYLKFDFQRVWQDRTDSDDATEEKIRKIRRRFKDAGFFVLANYIPHDVLHSCYGDKINHALINYNGDVFGCTARDFIKDNSIGRLNCKGEIEFDESVVQKRNNSKMAKSVCRECRIAPICGSGCKQRALEGLSSEGCTMNYSEDDIDRIILDIFRHSFNL